MNKNMNLKSKSKKQNSKDPKDSKTDQEQPNEKIDTMEESLNKKIKISKHIGENKKVLEEKLGVGESYDMVCREMNFAGKDFALFFVNGFAEANIMTEILRELSRLKREELVPGFLKTLMETYVDHIQVKKINTINEANDNVLSGQLAMFIDQEDEALIIDVRSYPGRTPQEPDTERVVRGARDGFTETLLVNTALTRRRIRDERLRMEIMQVGERSKTDVCIAYLKDVADPGLIAIIKQEIEQIKIDGFPMSEKALEEFLIKHSWNPYPLVRYTERPDVASAHLLEGHVLIYVDTSPSVIITPTTYFHHVQHAEEYRQTAVVGTYLRWVRFFGVFASLFLLPLWLIYVMEPDLLPDALNYIGPKDTSKIPVFLQLIFAELGLDLMRMAAVHTPTPLATAMGLIAAVLIGDIAITVGLFIPEVILYIAVAAVGMYATPSYELSLANKLARMIILSFVALFKIPGFVISTTILIIILTTTHSLNTPYLWPFIPFNLKAFMGILLRAPVTFTNIRPSIVHPQNQHRQN